MQQLVKQFNRENPDIRIIMQRMDWYTYYNKLFVAGIGGRAPEVFIIHASNIPRFIHADFLRPVDDLLEKEMGLDPKDFFPSAWNAAGYEGKQYGIPLDISIHGMYYNKTLFRAAGIVDEAGEPRPPRNQREFMEALRKLTLDRDGDGDTDQWGFVFNNTRNSILVLMVQFGGMFFDRDNQQCLLNSERNVRALTWCRDLIHQEKLVPSPENFTAWLWCLREFICWQTCENRPIWITGSPPSPQSASSRPPWPAPTSFACGGTSRIRNCRLPAVSSAS